jgi:F1F0 ATPase subunit 2
MTSEILTMIVAFIMGVLLGSIFFGGLWWTVLKGVQSKHPALWFLTSMLLRTSIVLAGFYFVSGGQLNRLLLCLYGFIIVRFIVKRLTRTVKPADLTPEVIHAS